jgi:hypothetical protein
MIFEKKIKNYLKTATIDSPVENKMKEEKRM